MDTFTDIHSGLQFCMKTGNASSDHILKHGIFEYSLIKWCEQYLTSEGVFVDIGAHMGTYSLILSKKCKEVYAFEAQRSTFDCLNIGICANNRYNIKAINVALGSNERIVTLHHVSEDGGGSTVRADIPTISNQKILNEEIVTMKTLDSYKIKNIDFIKIDVEGYELEVIKGASMTLIDNNFPPFIFEAWSDEWYFKDKDLLLSYVKDLGYKVYPISGSANMYLASDHPLRVNKEEKEEEKGTKYDILDLCKRYESNELKGDETVTWDIWHALCNHYRKISKHQMTLDCAAMGLKLSPPEKEHIFYEEISIVSYYVDKKLEGYQACDKVTLSHHAPWSARNYTLNNQSFYMRRLPFKKIVSIKYNLPDGYIETSPSIISYHNGFRCNLRSVNYTINEEGGYIIRDPDEIVRTRNFFLTIDKDLKVESGIELIDLSGVHLYPKNIRGLEDIRLFGNNEFLCTYLEVNDSRTPQICYCQYDPIKGDVTKVIPLMVGNELKCEKNWMPFIMNEEVHFIYTVHPLQIYKLDRDTGNVSLVKEVTLSDKYLNDFRGSSGLIPYKDGWLCTIHQVYHNNPRKYFHRFIWFDKDFSTMKYSEVFFFESAQIEFNLSLCHSNQGLIVPYSQRDNTAKIGILNYEILESWLKL